MQRLLNVFRGRAAVVLMWALASSTSAVYADHVLVDLEFRPMETGGIVGGTVDLGLYAVSADDENHNVSVIEAVLTWDPAALTLVGRSNPCEDGFFLCEFIGGDPCNLNDADLPIDGDGFFSAFTEFGVDVPATPEGLLVTVLTFEVGSFEGTTVVDIAEEGGNPVCLTSVFDGDIPNHRITGELGEATVRNCGTNPTVRKVEYDVDSVLRAKLKNHAPNTEYVVELRNKRGEVEDTQVVTTKANGSRRVRFRNINCRREPHRVVNVSCGDIDKKAKGTCGP